MTIGAWISKKYTVHYIYVCVVIVYILSFGGGLMLTWTSPVIPKLQTKSTENPLNRIITAEEESWITSMFSLGAVFGPFLWAFLVDRIGRKYTLLALAIPYVITYLVCAFAQTVELYYVGRFLAGFSIGGSFLMVPIYVSEICEDKVRGILSSGQNIAVTLSTVFAYLVGPYVSIMAFSLICLVFPLLFMVLALIFLTETPFHLVKKEDYSLAERSLMKYRARTSQMVHPELNVIKSTVHLHDDLTFKDTFKTKATIRGLIICLALMLFQQFSGITVILFNTQTIFEATETDIPADVSSILVGLLSFISAIVSVALVDRLGRKILFLVSGIGMFFSELLLGVYFLLKERGDDVSSISWLPILSLLAYISIYNLGFGPLPWTILAEVLPENVKSQISPFVSSFCWLLSFIVTKFYVDMKETMQLYGVFWLFTGFNALSVVFVYFALPETKGKSFQQIQAILNS